jgi:hypothetical protein
MLLIKRDPKIKRSDFDPLHIEEELPTTWTGPHVALRLTEAFITVLKMPNRDRGCLGIRSAWPAYMHEFEDLLAQQAQGELERTQEAQNRVRIPPTSAEIAAMEKALSWPATHLSVEHPDLLVAVNMLALAYALGLDAGWVSKKRGGFADTWRQRYDEGCCIIAAALIKARVTVF